jgi:thiol-disulfide isomerase/thioredoxin
MQMKMLVAMLSSLAICPRSGFVMGQVADFAPAQPVVGKEISIAYDATAPGAALKSPAEITAELLIMRDRKAPLACEVALTKAGQMWKGKCKLDDPQSLLLVVRFLSGEQVDDNSESCWLVQVCGSDGKPVQGANFQQAILSMSGGQFDFKYPRDLAKAKESTEAELSLYPANWRAEVFRLRIAMREKPDQITLAVIKRDLDRLYDANKGDEEAVAALLPLFEQTGQKDRADKIKGDATVANPRGVIAQTARTAEMMATRDPAKRVQLVEAFLTDFPDAADADRYRELVVNTYAGMGQPDKALAALSALPRPPGSLCNSIAWPMIEKGEDMGKGIALAKRGVDLLRSPDPASKPSYYTPRQWGEQNTYGLAAALDTYGYGLMKTGRLTEAERAFAEAYALLKGADTDVSERYVECLVANRNFERALTVCGEIVRRGKTNDKIRGFYKEAFVKTKGTETGFDSLVKGVEAEAQREFRKKLVSERLNEPAIDFSLRGMDGSVVRLADLKGKVIVIDFWATWCGPCKNSFPYLQKVYDAYRTNPRVAIYALNAWERVTGSERDAVVRKFIADNKYTFPVLFDDDTIEKYGVTGIPTKFVIDREGTLQFKSIGFEGGDAMMHELTNQLELLLSDDFYQK